MFGKRSDGKRIKTIDPIFKLIPHIMRERHDASNSTLLKIRCEYLDQYISKRRKEGININYMDIIIASIVRVFALKPYLNRFIMNGKIYKRDRVFVSFAVKKSLKETADETTIKLEFKGTENIFEVKKMVENSIKANCKADSKNNTDKTAKLFSIMPNFFLKLAVNFVKWLDKHGMMPRSIIKASPFHTSCFLTNMKSIHMDYIYHHLYDFGTTGMFVSMGKEKLEPVVNEKGEIVSSKIMSVGIVADERLCDGFYHANSLRAFRKIIESPELLEQNLESIVPDIK